MKNIKIGIDIHGVINKDPCFFSVITHKLRSRGHEVHILTGRELSDELLTYMDSFYIHYDHVFSITSYHKKIGTHISYKNGDPTQPLIAPPIWDSTKALYSKDQDLCLHIDDSLTYGKYFNEIKTQYLLYTPELRDFIAALMEVYL